MPTKLRTCFRVHWMATVPIVSLPRFLWTSLFILSSFVIDGHDWTLICWNQWIISCIDWLLLGALRWRFTQLTILILLTEIVILVFFLLLFFLSIIILTIFFLGTLIKLLRWIRSIFLVLVETLLIRRAIWNRFRFMTALLGGVHRSELIRYHGRC